MNEKRIEQVMQIEGRAQEILDSAKQEAARLPLEAEREAQDIMLQVRTEAKAAAAQMVAGAAAEDEKTRILADAEKRIHESEQLAEKNLDKAVKYVLARVLGRL